MVFIVGMPRSGSTLLENILSLKQVTDMGEVNFLEESTRILKILRMFMTYTKKKLLINLNPLLFIPTKVYLIICTVPIISNFFPKAKIINCIRNPLDNILSIWSKLS